MQYGIYVKNIVRGNLVSLCSAVGSIEHNRERLPATVELGIVAMLLSVLIGVPIRVSRQCVGEASWTVRRGYLRC